MLSTPVIVVCLIYLAVCTLICAYCLRYAWKANVFAQRAVVWTQENSEKSVALKQLEDYGIALADLNERHVALYESHKKLRSRVGMRELRERRSKEAAGDGDDKQLQLSDANVSKDDLREAAKKRGLL